MVTTIKSREDFVWFENVLGIIFQFWENHITISKVSESPTSNLHQSVSLSVPFSLVSGSVRRYKCVPSSLYLLV